MADPTKTTAMPALGEMVRFSSDGDIFMLCYITCFMLYNMLYNMLTLVEITHVDYSINST